MSTVAQIIAFADRKFPNTITEANKILDLNDIHNNIYLEIRKLKNDYEIDNDSLTVANQVTYTLPTDCKIENLFKIMVATTTASTEFEEYNFASLNDNIDVGRFYVPRSDTVIALLKDNKPIATTGLEIQFFYYPEPTAISTTTQTPDLDSRYHTVLKYYLTAELASEGRRPHESKANYWQQRGDKMMQIIKDNLSDKNNSAPNISNQVEEYW